MKRRQMKFRTGPRTLSLTAAAAPHPDEIAYDGQLARGVHLAPFRVAGYRVLLAVNSHGDRVLEMPLAPSSPGETEQDAWLGLKAWLDVHDPVQGSAPPRAPLALVRDGEEYDVCAFTELFGGCA